MEIVNIITLSNPSIFPAQVPTAISTAISRYLC